MEEDSKPSDSDSVKEQPLLCEECKVSQSKYRCPGCRLRTCSLPCVNSHKKRTACTGKRPVAESVPISRFDDDMLLSDYALLEDVKRFSESVKRVRAKVCGNSVFRPPLPFPLKNLRNAAMKRRTKIIFLSKGMSKREANQTYYNYRKRSIFWTIEWQFHSTDVVLVDHQVHEDRSFFSVIENHLKPGPWKHVLKQFCDHPDSLKFFIRKYPKGVKSPFRQLKIMAPIRDQLADLVILEYPVIHVFLPEQSCDFEIITDYSSIQGEVKPIDDSPPSPGGVLFKEEEIEDDGSLDPLISDLLNQRHTDIQIEQKEDLPRSTTDFKRMDESRLFIKLDDQLLNAGHTLPSLQPCVDYMHQEHLFGDGFPYDFELDDEEKLMEQFLLDEELEEGEIQ